MGSRQQLSKEQLESVTVEDSEISVRNLGAYLMGIHVSKVCSKALRYLYSISSWLLQLPALWFPKYQHDPLQRILSSCSCLHCLLGIQVQSPHTSLYNLHWLPVPYPLSSRWCRPCLPKEVSKIQGSGPYNLRSNASCELKRPETKCKTLGDTAFSHLLWNTLPSAMRSIGSV